MAYQDGHRGLPFSRMQGCSYPVPGGRVDGRGREYIQASGKAMSEDIFEGREVTEEVTLRVLGEAEEALEREGIPHMLMGGLASSAHGRPRWTNDIDVLVRPADSGRALQALGNAGFETQETDPFWLYKGVKDGVLVDVIFRSTGDIYLDDEMLAHARPVDLSGVRVCMVSPDELVGSGTRRISRRAHP